MRPTTRAKRIAVFPVLCACISLFALSISSSWADPWPQRPVKFILPLGAGSGVDITARMFADRLSKRWGRPVVVENHPGGDGFAAITEFVSAHDDHTLLFSPASVFTAHPYLHDKLPYDARDLAPIAQVSNTIVALAVPQSLKVASLADLVAMVRAQPGKLNWASATGANDFLFEGFLKVSGLAMARVPYRNTVQAVNDLAEGRIQAYVGALAIMRPQVQAGKVKILAITNRKRASASPEIPTVAEAGFPGLGFDGLVGLFGPPDMRNDLRERIATDIRAVANDPEIVQRMTATGQVVSPGTSAGFAAAIDAQRAQIASVARVLGYDAAKSTTGSGNPKAPSAGGTPPGRR